MSGTHIQWAGPLFPGHQCSVGYAVIDFIIANCCYGPGDLQGEYPVVIDDEMFDFIVECYRIDPVSGQKSFDEAVLSRPKGRAKTEIAGWLVIAEAFGPCRFSHWDDNGQPVARRVVSPLVKCLATEESQATAAFSVVAYIAADWGKEHRPEIFAGVSGARQYQSAKALYINGGGEIRACTSGSASKDGGKETFCVSDETHLYVLPELRQMYGTVRRNLGKRKIAEPWLLQTSTAYKPGEESVFETTLTAWRQDELAKTVYINHREAKGRIDIQDEKHTLAQLRYVYGAASEWMDLNRIYREMLDVRSCPDEAVAARYFLNRSISGTDAWIPDAVVKRQTRPQEVAPGTAITLGFDGSVNDDATVLFGCRMLDGFIFPIQIWAKPGGAEANWWVVPHAEVMAEIRASFERYDVVNGYFDPPYWRSDIDVLQEEFGDRVVAWETARFVAMGSALDRLHSDLVNGIVFHNGDPVMMEHFMNAYVKQRGTYRLVRKEHDKSDRKIDSVIGAALAYEARADTLSSGWTATPATVDRRVLVFRR